MTRVNGIPIQGGVSIGPIHFINRVKQTAQKMSKLSPSSELARFEAAKDRLADELKRLQLSVAARLGNDEAAIFLFQSMLLDDEDYLDTIYHHIKGASTAEYAVDQAGQMVSDFFSSLDDSYMKARAADAKDISHNLNRILTDESIPQYSDPFIVVSEELSPSVPALFFKNNLLGMASQYGSVESHAAILARAAKIPAVTGIRVNPSWDGHMAIIDGDNGTLTIDPDDETKESASEKAKRSGGYGVKLTGGRHSGDGNADTFHDGPNHAARLTAIVNSNKEAELAYRKQADGIGLYQTHGESDGRTPEPSEEDRFDEYRQTVAAMHGRPVIFQSLNVGAAKRRPFGGSLHGQFRAILRAAADGPALIALSDITGVKDIPMCRKLLDSCKTELAAEGLDYRSADLGAIIRTPSSVLYLDTISPHTDFIALDAGALLQSLERCMKDRVCPDFLIYAKMLQTAVRSAHSHAQRIMLFGNLQKYLQAVTPLYRMGIDELSVPVIYLSDVRQACAI